MGRPAVVETSQRCAADDLESKVRLYPSHFPTTFTRAKGAIVENHQGERFIDFFCASGSVNYGHNPERIKQELIHYLSADGLVQALDLDTAERIRLLEAIAEVILEPRGLDYKVQFCGPTGTSAIEAALALARKATGREGVVAFAGSFHGMSAGSLSVSGNRSRQLNPSLVPGTCFIPF